ncbi:MAG: ArsR/SmtB family transcription factor [Bacillota bacterium]
MTIREEYDTGVCQSTAIHDDVVREVEKKLNSDEVLLEMADLFKAMNDPTRLKIINALLIHEMCVCDLTALLNLTQPAVSHHLKALRQARLVKFRREGKAAYYSLDDDHIQLLFDQCHNHVTEEM